MIQKYTLNRRSHIITVLILAVLILQGFNLLHEFYVSLTEIRYNSESERMEVSMRIFPDDMDRALMEHHGINANLLTEYEHPEADSLLESYLNDLFTIELDGSRLSLSYLGKESESDVMWCYLESGTVEKPGKITIYNSILTEIFEDQVNIIQVYVGKWNKGLLLKREEARGSLVIDD